MQGVSVVAEDSVPATGFFAKLRSRVNRGKAWLTGEIGQLLARGLDAATIEELKEQLILADVGGDAAEWIVASLQRSAAASGRDSRELLTQAVAELLRPLARPLSVACPKRPFVILVVGVNGTGKTTSAGKLGYKLKQAGHSVLLAAADTFRAAAVEQLEVWGRRIGAPVIAQHTGADPAAVVHDALAAARARNVDVVIVDTAGRLHTAAGLMAELEKIKRVTARFDAAAPHEILLVLDASQGQNALTQAREFHARLGVTGLVLTKLDGTAKGGIALAVARNLAIPFRYIGVGETIEDFDEFDADEFAAALTGSEPA